MIFFLTENISNLIDNVFQLNIMLPGGQNIKYLAGRPDSKKVDFCLKSYIGGIIKLFCSRVINFYQGPHKKIELFLYGKFHKTGEWCASA